MQGLVNPNNDSPNNIVNGNKYFPNSVTDKLPGTIRILGIIYLAISVTGSLLLETPTQEETE